MLLLPVPLGAPHDVTVPLVGTVEHVLPITALATHIIEHVLPITSDLLSVVTCEHRMPIEGDYPVVEHLMPISPADLEGLRFERRTRPIAESVFA